VGGAEHKYTLDTNLFVDALRFAAAKDDLQRFHTLFAPFEYLSAVVAQELLAGTRSLVDQRTVHRNLIDPFVRRTRLVTPSYRAWEMSGEVLARLVRDEGLTLISKALANDVLLALSCREAGVTLVTANVKDFKRIARIVPFRFVPPWPKPSARRETP
jgi:predicted nucleic acid-binding protein